MVFRIIQSTAATVRLDIKIISYIEPALYIIVVEGGEVARRSSDGRIVTMQSLT